MDLKLTKFVFTDRAFLCEFTINLFVFLTLEVEESKLELLCRTRGKHYQDQK